MYDNAVLRLEVGENAIKERSVMPIEWQRDGRRIEKMEEVVGW